MVADKRVRLRQRIIRHARFQPAQGVVGRKALQGGLRKKEHSVHYGKISRFRAGYAPELLPS